MVPAQPLTPRLRPIGGFWGSSISPSWIEITWKEPVVIRELVVRRYQAERGTRDLTHLEAETLQNGSWRKLVPVWRGQNAIAQTHLRACAGSIHSKVTHIRFRSKGADSRNRGLFEEYGCLDGRRRVGDYFPGAIQFQSGIWGGGYQTLVDVACSNDLANGIRRSRLPLRTWQSPLPTVEIPLTNRCKQLVRRQHGGHGGYVENYGDGKLLHTGEHIHSTLHLSPLKAN